MKNGYKDLCEKMLDILKLKENEIINKDIQILSLENRIETLKDYIEFTEKLEKIKSECL